MIQSSLNDVKNISKLFDFKYATIIQQKRNIFNKWNLGTKSHHPYCLKKNFFYRYGYGGAGSIPALMAADIGQQEEGKPL